MRKRLWRRRGAEVTALRMALLVSLLPALTLVVAGKGIKSGISDVRRKPRPNIIVFLVDDMGWQETSVPFHREVTPLNRLYRTPNMERLAAGGMKFTQAYASAVCSPSRISILSGMNASRHGVTNWTLRRDTSPDEPHPGFRPPDWNVNGAATIPGIERTIQITALPQLLRNSGYQTIHVGKAHFGAKGTPGEDPRHFGFEVNIGGHAAGAPGSYYGERNFSSAWRTKPPEHIWDVPGLEAYHGREINLTEVLTHEAIRAVETAAAKPDPFYLYFSHYAVHAPWEEDKRFYAAHLARGLKPFEALRASMLEGMDKSLGDLMAALDRLGIANQTAILFISDNGAPHDCPRNLPLRGQKLSPYEGGVRVPMIARWPGVTPPGSTCETPVIIEDLFTTILDLAGARWRGRTIQTVDGLSLLPLLAGGSRPDRSGRPLIWHFPHYYYRQEPFSAIRQGPWKLIRYHTDQRVELFNIENDISETTDLSGRFPDRCRELSHRLESATRRRP